MESSAETSGFEKKAGAGRTSASAVPQSGPVPGSRKPRRARRSWRGVWVLVHRYTGLAIATFLVVAGLTGSAITFYRELDGLINPNLIRVQPPSPGAEPMDPLELRERAMEQVPGWKIDRLALDHDPGYSTTFWQKQESGDWRAVFVDPYTGELLGFRSGTNIAEGIEYLMPFLYRLHYALALGKTGTLLFGIVALLWTIDCLVGFYLTLPPRSRRKTGSAKPSRSWLSRWKPSWLIKGGSLFRSLFTFHRASGLWMWPVLFVFAWSAVGFNLHPVYEPVMKLFGTGPDVRARLPDLEEARPEPALGWPEALERARELMADEAESRDFTLGEEGWLSYDPSHGVFQYRVHSSRDVGARNPGTRLWFDGDSGELLAFRSPTGIAAGDTIGSWLFSLHMATVGGLAYRVFVCVLGFAIAALSVTGVWMWWKKRRARRRPARAAG